MPSGRSKQTRVAIVGASSLRGKELRQVLEDRNFPASDFVLLDESVVAGTLTEAAGEPTFIRALDQESFEGAEFAFFAGTARDAEQNWKVAQRSGATVIDLTGALAGPGHGSGANAWIPSLGSVLPARVNSKGNGTPPPASGPASYVSPSAPVILACTVAAGLSNFQAQRISVLLFPPVSEREEAGVEELEKQTTGLLVFHEIAKPVFDAQVAFNLLASYGPASKPRLADMRASIARDVAAYLNGRAPVPAIQLVQSASILRVCFRGICGFRSTRRAGATSRGIRESGSQGCGAGRHTAEQHQRGGRRRDSSRAGRGRPKCCRRRVVLGRGRQFAARGDKCGAHRGGIGCESDQLR